MNYVVGFPNFGCMCSPQVKIFLVDKLSDKSLLFLKDTIKFNLVCNTFIAFETTFCFYNML